MDLEMHVRPGYPGQRGVQGAPPKEAPEDAQGRDHLPGVLPTARGNHPGYGSTSGPGGIIPGAAKPHE
jgi:hypothetical protein